MKDISDRLTDIMNENNCSSVYALLLFSDEVKDVQVLQPESKRKSSWGLRDKSDKQINRTRLGNDLY